MWGKIFWDIGNPRPRTIFKNPRFFFFPHWAPRTKKGTGNFNFFPGQIHLPLKRDTPFSLLGPVGLAGGPGVKKGLTASWGHYKFFQVDGKTGPNTIIPHFPSNLRLSPPGIIKKGQKIPREFSNFFEDFLKKIFLLK